MGCDGCELWALGRGVRASYAGNDHARRAGLPGWPRSFDRTELFTRRIDEACRWPDLSGHPRPDKPWLDGYPARRNGRRPDNPGPAPANCGCAPSPRRSPPVDLQTFTAAVEAEVRQRHTPFEQRDVITFPGDVWPRVLTGGADVPKWMGLLLQARQEATTS
jgi:hypothetical protein